MAVNGFAAGKRIWVEICAGTIRADYIGTVLYVTESKAGYCIQFVGGFVVNFSEEDLRQGRVNARIQPRGE